jgi:hypothetical protein
MVAKKRLTPRQQAEFWLELERYLGVMEYSQLAGLRKRLPDHDETWASAFSQIVEIIHWMGDQADQKAKEAQSKAKASKAPRLPGL